VKPRKPECCFMALSCSASKPGAGSGIARWVAVFGSSRPTRNCAHSWLDDHFLEAWCRCRRWCSAPMQALSTAILLFTKNRPWRYDQGCVSTDMSARLEASTDKRNPACPLEKLGLAERPLQRRARQETQNLADARCPLEERNSSGGETARTEQSFRGPRRKNRGQGYDLSLNATRQSDSTRVSPASDGNLAELRRSSAGDS